MILTGSEVGEWKEQYRLFMCDCYAHGIMVSYWFEDEEDFDDIQMSFWQHGQFGMTLWQKLKCFWGLLRDETMYCDMVVLDIAKTRKLGEHLITIADDWEKRKALKEEKP